jgi:DDE superfamily endonuclease
MEIIGDHGGYVSGEYATLYMMYRLHYPSKLFVISLSWGRDYSSLSRIFNTSLSCHYDLHARKVLTNISWNSDRFDMYHQSIQRKILACGLNPREGHIPANLNNIFGFLDCTANAICRPKGNDNIQNSFYNGYHHGHFIIWQGVSFPDGMIIIEGPEPGHFTDIMVWRDSQIRQDIDREMDIRVTNGQQILKLYADEIYNVCPVVTPAWSRRQGAIQEWMTVENIMSRIRVAIEWTFGTIIMLY